MQQNVASDLSREENQKVFVSMYFKIESLQAFHVITHVFFSIFVAVLCLCIDFI